jgi:DNA-binding LytR/AlgR family response regulator
MKNLQKSEEKNGGLAMKEVLILGTNSVERRNILSVIREINRQVRVYSAETEEDALLMLMQKEINIVIVDVVSRPDYYGDISGLKFIEQIRKIERYRYTPIIILTNLEDPGKYIINEFHCFGLLEKPIAMDLFKKIVKDALSIPIPKKRGRNIFFKQDGILCALNADKIIYIENRERILLIHTIEETVMIKYETAKRFLKKIRDERFVQCSRQAIINVDYIKEIDFVNRYVTLKEINKMVEIGSGMKNKFRDTLEHCNLGLWL